MTRAEWFLTDFADQAVILPLVLAVALMLAALGWRRGAAAWVLAVGATLGTMLVLKLAFLACGTVLPSIGVHTPSGHTAAAALAAGSLAALLSRGNNRGGHVLAWALGAAIVVGVTRVALAMHSVAEVLVGGLVGVLGALLLARLAGPAPERLRVAGLGAVVLAVLILFHGLHLRAEAQIAHTASLLRLWPLAACRS